MTQPSWRGRAAVREGPLPRPLIVAIGLALWGTRWQSDMARDLGVSDRTVRRWVAGDHVPPGIYADLAEIARERRTDIDALLWEMEQR